MSRKPGQERERATGLRLRTALPVVVSLSRWALALIAGTGCLAIAGVTGWMLARHPHNPPAAHDAPAQAPAAPPQQLAALPKDYASLPPDVPKLGPPLPGDLGRPILAAQGVEPTTIAGASSPINPAEQQRQAEAQQARASRLFALQSAATAPSSVAITAAPSTTVAVEPLGEGSRAATAPAASVGPDALLAGATPNPAVSDSRLRPAASPYLLQAGAMIRAALITGIRSDLPGPVSAQVTQDVFDSVTGRWRLIPQGSRLLGTYENQVGFGQRRVMLAWTRLILPDGRSIDLGRAPAADAQGYAGLADGVERKWRQILASSMVSTVLGMGSQLGAGVGDSQILQALRTGAANSANQVGQQLVGKSLDLQPSLTIRPGFPVFMVLTKDLVLEPWEP